MHNSDYHKRKQERKVAYALNIKKIAVVCEACSGTGYYDFGGRRCRGCEGKGIYRRMPNYNGEKSIDRKTRKQIRACTRNP